MGLIFVAAFLLTFLVTWVAAIFVFMCLGPKQAGFLSGHPFTEPEPFGDGHLDAKPFRRPRRVRWTFLVCNVSVIAFSIIFVTHGMYSFQETVMTLDKSNEYLRGFVSRSANIASDLISIGDNSKPIRDALVGRLGNFCPNGPDLPERTGVDFDGIAKETVAHLDTLHDFVEDEMVEFQSFLGQVEDVTKSIDQSLALYGVSEWKVMIYVLPVITLSGLLLIGLLMAWFEVSFKEYQFLTKYVFVPLFGIVVALSWIVCSLFALLSVTNSDFCSGGATANYSPSPEGTILEILNEQGVNPNSTVHAAVKFYIDGCLTSFPFGIIEDFKFEVDNAFNFTLDFKGALGGVGKEKLVQICGDEVDFDGLKNLLDEIGKTLKSFATLLVKTRRFLSCESINHLYTNTFHEGTCNHAITGLAWAFSSLLIISFCGMLMIMFRASLYHVIWFEDFAGPDTIEGSGGDYAEQEYHKENQYGYGYEGEDQEHTQPEVYLDSYDGEYAQDDKNYRSNWG
mmetsp:Transcript_2743/g.5913  ORF Transcript_2743/g.5913 Transcript_2743/m.5913 type:complete len:510 (-) Transcript_2743:255-1784(-)